MALIDNFTGSKLYEEITDKFAAGVGTSAPVTVTFGALELACQQAPSTDADVLTAVNIITTATGWTAKVLYSEQKVELRK